MMIARYTVDGISVSATRLNRGFPGVYAVRCDDGPILGYVQRTLLGGSEAYAGSAAPDAVDAQLVGAHQTMRYAVEHVVRAATSPLIAGMCDST